MPFDEKELEIKAESIPNTKSGGCLAERCVLVQVHVLAQPALQWVLGGCSELGPIRVSKNAPCGGLTFHLQDLIKCIFFSKNDAVEAGVAQLSV